MHMTIREVFDAVAAWQRRSPLGESRGGGCRLPEGGPDLMFYRQRDGPPCDELRIDMYWLLGPLEYNLGRALDAFDWHAGLPAIKRNRR